MKHELWIESDQEQTFCLAGPQGDEARSLLSTTAKLVWQVEASSHFEAMTKYYKHMGWGKYTTDFQEQDKRTYAELGCE